MMASLRGVVRPTTTCAVPAGRTTSRPGAAVPRPGVGYSAAAGTGTGVRREGGGPRGLVEAPRCRYGRRPGVLHGRRRGQVPRLRGGGVRPEGLHGGGRTRSGADRGRPRLRTVR